MDPLKHPSFEPTPDISSVDYIRNLKMSKLMKRSVSPSFTTSTPSSTMEDCVVFQQLDLFSQGFPVMEEIRRQGKLCDVTIKVF